MTASKRLLAHFQYSHLPEVLQKVSKPICELAKQLDNEIADGPEKTVGLRKLLEAKDCMVRAALEGVHEANSL